MGNENTTKAWLDPPDLKGVKNADGTYTLSGTDLQAQRDFNYYVAKMLQGGLNLANLNKETNEVFTGKVSFIDLSDPTKSTVINGNHITTGAINADLITTGTLQGVTLISYNPSTTSWVTIGNGKVALATQGGMTVGGLYFDANESKIILKSEWGMPLKLLSANNMSLDVPNGSVIYVGTSNTNERVDIGSATATVNINGNSITVNGNPYGAAVFT